MRKLFWLAVFVVAYPVSSVGAQSTPWPFPTSYATLLTSCYTPEVPYAANDGANGLDGQSDCPGIQTGESVGPYPSQAGSKPGFPASSPKLVKNHSESDIRVDPNNAQHLIGTSKWFASSEGYNHLLGFYESFDGGQTWPFQGHVPGYEGFTDNTDPVGAFDGEGNFYVFILPYQFTYDASGHHDFSTGSLPNPNLPDWAVSIAVLKAHGSTEPAQWNTTTPSGQLDYVATYHSVGNNPDKQWIAIDTHKTLPNGSPNPNYDNVYTMWVAFDSSFSSLPQVSVARSNGDGTHTAWSQPMKLPLPTKTQADTYLLPHIAPDGSVYTTVVQTPSAMKRLAYNVFIDFSSDGGSTWQGPLTVSSAQGVAFPPLCFGPFGCYQNTTFRDGIPNSFGVGQHLVQGHYPLYLAFEAYDGGLGVANVLITASYDGGNSWSSPLRVNDNLSAVDEFQPSLAVSPTSGTVSVAFYDRRRNCPDQGTDDATNAGLALDTVNPRYPNIPRYGAHNYCVDTSIQFFDSALNKTGPNVRLTQHNWDPQLNAAHYSCATCGGTFIGDYFGNDISSAGIDYVTTVTTFNENNQNPNYRQQQLVIAIPIPS